MNDTQLLLLLVGYLLGNGTYYGLLLLAEWLDKRTSARIDFKPTSEGQLYVLSGARAEVAGG